MGFSAPALTANTTATQASSSKLESGSTKNLAQAATEDIKDLEKATGWYKEGGTGGAEFGTAPGSIKILKAQISRSEGGTGMAASGMPRKIVGTP